MDLTPRLSTRQLGTALGLNRQALLTVLNHATPHVISPSLTLTDRVHLWNQLDAVRVGVVAQVHDAIPGGLTPPGRRRLFDAITWDRMIDAVQGPPVWLGIDSSQLLVAASPADLFAAEGECTDTPRFRGPAIVVPVHMIAAGILARLGGHETAGAA